MSAVLKPHAEAPGIEVAGRAPGQDRLLTPEALAFLARLHRHFEPQRQLRLAARQARQAEFDAGALPAFRDDTRAIRDGDWRVAPIPAALLDRRVEITGPVDPSAIRVRLIFRWPIKQEARALRGLLVYALLCKTL